MGKLFYKFTIKEKNLNLQLSNVITSITNLKCIPNMKLYKYAKESKKKKKNNNCKNN